MVLQLGNCCRVRAGANTFHEARASTSVKGLVQEASVKGEVGGDNCRPGLVSSVSSTKSGPKNFKLGLKVTARQPEDQVCVLL